MQAIERLGIANDTLVVFCSDNGPVLDDGSKDDAVEKLGDHRPAGPFRAKPAPVVEALYNLDADPDETTDVRDQFPDVAAQLSKNLDEIIQR